MTGEVRVLTEALQIYPKGLRHRYRYTDTHQQHLVTVISLQTQFHSHIFYFFARCRFSHNTSLLNIEILINNKHNIDNPALFDKVVWLRLEFMPRFSMILKQGFQSIMDLRRNSRCKSKLTLCKSHFKANIKNIVVLLFYLIRQITKRPFLIRYCLEYLLSAATFGNFL